MKKLTKTMLAYIDLYIGKEITLSELCEKMKLPKPDVYDILEDRGISIFNELSTKE